MFDEPYSLARRLFEVGSVVTSLDKERSCLRRARGAQRETSSGDCPWDLSRKRPGSRGLTGAFAPFVRAFSRSGIRRLGVRAALALGALVTDPDA